MIYQRDDLSPLRTHPARSMPRLAWRFRWLIRLMGKLLRDDRRSRPVRRLERLLAQVGRCEYRSQLERLLGPPRYALSGEGYGGLAEADTAEVYERGRCHIELGFVNRRHQWTIGYVTPSLFDILAHAAETDRNDTIDPLYPDRHPE